jgi:hypothetical protein
MFLVQLLEPDPFIAAFCNVRYRFENEDLNKNTNNKFILGCLGLGLAIGLCAYKNSYHDVISKYN